MEQLDFNWIQLIIFLLSAIAIAPFYISILYFI